MSAVWWIAENWRTVLFFLLLVALGVQTYRLDSVQGEYASYRMEVELATRERQREDIRRKAIDDANKRRIDGTYRRALARARAERLLTPATGNHLVEPATPGGGDQSTVCYDRGRLNAELSAFSGRTIERLEGLLAQSAELAAAYSACAEWARAVGSDARASAPSAARRGDGVARAAGSLPL